MGIIEVILAVIGVIATGAAFIFKRKSDDNKADADASKAAYEAAKARADAESKSAAVSASEHNKAVESANKQKEVISEQAKQDRAAVGDTSDVGLQHGSSAIAAAAERANGSL